MSTFRILYIVCTVILITVLVYWTFSISEWVLHKYVMHKPASYIGRQHIMHHISTNTHTMRLDTTIPNYEIVLPDENLCLDTETAVYVFMLFILLSGGIYIISHNTYYAIYAMCLCTIIGAFLFGMWNSIHPYLHRRNGRDITPFALPSWAVYRIRNNWYINKMLKNHIMHHVIKGPTKGNFNTSWCRLAVWYSTFTNARGA